MHKVRVLMSTYNGEAYIKEQIESILQQRDVQVDLLVRDDGSRDATLSILASYQKDHKLTYYQGKNLRSAYSFWDLIETAQTSSYYAFADQDDVWYDDKLISAIQKLAPYDEIPALYFCRKHLVDEQLKPLQIDDEIVSHLGLGTNLIHCHAAGCTMVFNHALMKLLKRYKPAVMSMHDSWILRVASACGNVVYDEQAHMDYRQHAHNVVGANTTGFTVIKKRLHTLTKRRQDDERSIMARQLYDHYAEDMINEEDKRMLANFADIRSSFKARRQLIQSSFLQPHNASERKFVKLMVLLGWM